MNILLHFLLNNGTVIDLKVDLADGEVSDVLTGMVPGHVVDRGVQVHAVGANPAVGLPVN